MSSIGYIRCGIGSAAPSAIVQRLYNWSTLKNGMNASSGIDGAVLPFDLTAWSDTVSVISKQAMMMSVKECFGYLVLLGMLLTLLVMLSNYKTAVVRLVPRMATIRLWLTNEKTGDPKGTIREKPNLPVAVQEKIQ